MAMTPAQRQKLRRARARRGKAVLRPSVDYFAFIDVLLESTRLTEQEALDRRKVDEAAAAVLEDWIAKWRKESRHA